MELPVPEPTSWYRSPSSTGVSRSETTLCTSYETLEADKGTEDDDEEEEEEEEAEGVQAQRREFKKRPRSESPPCFEISSGRCQRCKELKLSHFGPVTGGLSHHKFQDLKLLASGGCELCKYLLADINSADAVGTAEVTLDWSAGLINYRFRLSERHAAGTGKVSSTFEAWDDQDQHQVVGATDELGNAAKTIKKVYRRIAPDPRDEYCVSLASRWIATCLATHSRCAPTVNRSSPTRLLNIKDGDPFLVLASEKKLSYATLSYCWGSYKQSTTTTSNLKSHKRAINMSTLPQCFQDAIWLSRKLGVDYLWIDALCILQDLDSDKAHECARMGDYYRNSVFTISSLDTTDASHGFLAPRPFLDEVKLFMNSECFLRRRSHTRAAVFKKAPLNQRGWTLQERLLSSRVLHYSRTEMFWECLTCTGREGSTVEHRDTEQIRNMITSESEDFKRITFSADIDPFDPDFGALAIWYRLITHFARRSLKYQDDKLPAIAGLAATMRSKIGYSYMAGVWKEDLEGLLWRSELLITPSGSNNSTFHESNRISSLPSWAWASLNTHTIEWPPARELRHKHPLDASVVSTNIDVDPNNPYGNVKHASLTLFAACERVKCTWVEYTPSHQLVPQPPPRLSLYWHFESGATGYSHWTRYACFDELSTYGRTIENNLMLYNGKGKEFQHQTTWILPGGLKQCMAIRIASRQKMVTTIHYFLLVVEDQNEPGCWKRVGMGFTWHWPSELRRTVVLV